MSRGKYNSACCLKSKGLGNNNVLAVAKPNGLVKHSNDEAMVNVAEVKI